MQPIPNPIPNTDPAELIEIAKRALAKGELEIAEKYSVNAMRTGMLDNSSRKRPEPYFYLAEILQKRAEGRELELLQKQRYLLQAAALYNFVCSYLKSVDTDDELSKNLSEIVSRKLRNIQNNLIELCGGDPRQCRFDAKSKRKELMNLRNEVKELLKPLESRCSSSNQDRSNKSEAQQIFINQTEELKRLSDTVSDKMKQFFASIIDECLALLGTPPCDYEVIVFGSLARNETTPYSDFEWAILTSSEEMECKVFFRNLTNLVHLQVGEMYETYVERRMFTCLSYRIKQQIYLSCYHLFARLIPITDLLQRSCSSTLFQLGTRNGNDLIDKQRDIPLLTSACTPNDVGDNIDYTMLTF